MHRSLFVAACHSSDPRLRAMTGALAAGGGEVDVVCFRDTGESPSAASGGVRFLRLPIRRAGGSVPRLLFEEAAFFVLAFVASSVLAIRRRYDLFHSRGTPDLLVFAGILHRLRGARVEIDLPEPAPELARDRHGLAIDSPFVRALGWMETFSIGCADVALTKSEEARRAIAARGVDPARVRVAGASAAPFALTGPPHASLEPRIGAGRDETA